MSVLEKILSVLTQAKSEETTLSLEDTLTVFDAVKHISNDKVLIEKAIYLIFLVKNNEPKIEKLTQRENEIFRLIGIGLTSKEIAEMIKISESTVSTHRKKIIKKLELSGSGQLQKLSMQLNQRTAV